MPEHDKRTKLHATPLENTSNFAGGVGDQISFGLTAKAREPLIRYYAGADGGYGDGCDHDSKAYAAGEYTGVLYEIATIMVGSIQAAGEVMVGHEFSHFLPNRWVGKCHTIWNGNYVSKEVHALSDPFRYRFMPAAWKACNKPMGFCSKWIARIPNTVKGTAASAWVACVHSGNKDNRGAN